MIRRCKHCNSLLSPNRGELPREFAKREFCWIGCRRAYFAAKRVERLANRPQLELTPEQEERFDLFIAALIRSEALGVPIEHRFDFAADLVRAQGDEFWQEVKAA